MNTFDVFCLSDKIIVVLTIDLYQPAFPQTMDAFLIRKLTIVILSRVQWYMSITNIMTNICRVFQD